MKKQLFLFLGLLAAIGIMAQTNKAETKKDGTKASFTKDEITMQADTNGGITPITTESFNQILELIKSKKADFRKLAIAKISVKDKNLLSRQVKEIAFLFTHAETRFTFAKYAYKYTIDKENYNSEIDLCFSVPSYPVPSAKANISSRHNELNDNWERTNKANVVYTNWVYSSYGTDNNQAINR